MPSSPVAHVRNAYQFVRTFVWRALCFPKFFQEVGLLLSLPSLLEQQIRPLPAPPVQFFFPMSSFCNPSCPVFVSPRLFVPKRQTGSRLSTAELRVFALGLCLKPILSGPDATTLVFCILVSIHLGYPPDHGISFRPAMWYKVFRTRWPSALFLPFYSGFVARYLCSPAVGMVFFPSPTKRFSQSEPSCAPRPFLRIRVPVARLFFLSSCSLSGHTDCSRYVCLGLSWTSTAGCCRVG